MHRSLLPGAGIAPGSVAAVRLSAFRRLVLALTLALLAAPASAAAVGRCGDHPWCDTALSPGKRAELLVSQLTIAEKADLLWGDEQVGVVNPPGGILHSGKNYGNLRTGLPDLVMSDGPVGPRQGSGATSMPAPLGLAAAFDPALAAQAGGLVADEVKAKGNDLVFAPTVNIMRTPRGGRTFEGYGEDPFLVARTAVGWIKGAQARGVVANVKHFAANNQETDRMTSSSELDERTLREIYLPQFEAAVKEAGVGSVMCSYNKLRGQYACENRHLLKDILRDEWGFKGFVLADYPAAHSTVDSLKNGLDFEPFGTAYNPVSTLAALAQGQVTEADVTAAVTRIVRTMFAFGVLDREAYRNDDAQILVQEHADLAQRISEGGITLLRNERGVLPLKPGGKLALIGSDAARFKSGGGSSNVTPLKLVTPKQGIEGRAGKDTQVVFDDTDDPAHSAATAKDADVAVVVVSDTATEGEDTTCIRIDCTDDKVVNGFSTQAGTPRNLDAVIAAVAKANPRTVVVMETSGPVLTPWRGDVAALVEAWYPGESGGAAIARVLFGDVDPSGRLPATFPDKQSDLATEGDPESFPGKDLKVQYKEGVLVGYRWFDEKGITPAYAFGHGLSYTSFAFSDLRLQKTEAGATVGATVKNTGRRAGTAVPQLYVGLPEAPGRVQPPEQLRGFDKLELKPGESRRVRFSLDERALSFWDTGKDAWAVAPGCYRVSVGSSSRDLPLKGALERGGSCTVSKRCASKRAFTIRLPRSMRSATVTVAGKRVAVRRSRGRLTARVVLTGRDAGRVVVRATGRTASGRTVRQVRTFRTCTRRT